MDIRKVVGLNLRKMRVAAELSQEILAVDAEIDRTHVGRIERGTENVTILVLDRLAKALGVTIESFFSPPRPGESVLKPLPKGRKKKARL